MRKNWGIIFLIIFSYFTVAKAQNNANQINSFEKPSAEQLDRANEAQAKKTQAKKTQTKKAQSKKSQTSGTLDKIEDSFIRSNIVVSDWVNNMAEGLDIFLAGQSYTRKKNQTSALVSTSHYHSKYGGDTTNVDFNLNLRLPNVEEYWMLTFTSYDEIRERGVSQGYFRQSPRERDYGASLGFMENLGDVKTTYQPRISFQGYLNISNQLAFESIAERKDGLKINPKIKLYADASKGAGIFGSLNFHKPLTKIYTLTFINEGDYGDRLRLFEVTNGFSLGQWISRFSSISYNAFLYSKSRPNYRLKGYSLSTSWSHIIYRNILDYQLIPNVSFSDERNFRADPGITATVNLRF